MKPSLEQVNSGQDGNLIIGIEGSAGAGKTTMANTVAREMGGVVVEGGSWYRALTFRAIQLGIGPDETEKLIRLAENLGLDVQNSPSGTHLMLDGTDSTELLHSDAISTKVGPYAQNLKLREVLEPHILASLRQQKLAFMVGRNLKKLIPEAQVLRLEIDPVEADKRHQTRLGQKAVSLADRNRNDAITAQLLGVADDEGITTVDVTHLDKDEQASLLRQFVLRQQNTEGKS